MSDFQTNFKEPQKFFEALSFLEEEKLRELTINSLNMDSRQLIKFLDYIFDQIQIIELNYSHLLDCCGTGGDKSNTFNISTTAAIIGASIGLKIAKNGGRSSSSTTGSVDVLEALGFNLNANLETKLLGLEKYNLGFFSSQVSAELLAPIKKISRQLKQPSFLSLLAPFLSPVSISHQIIGVGSVSWIEGINDLSQYLTASGRRKRIILVQSILTKENLVLDELSSVAEASVIDINSHGINQQIFKPENLGLLRDNYSDIQGASNHLGNAEIILNIIKPNREDAYSRTALLNAALMSYLSKDSQALNPNDFHERLKEEFLQVKNALLSGGVKKNFEALIHTQKCI